MAQRLSQGAAEFRLPTKNHAKFREQWRAILLEHCFLNTLSEFQFGRRFAA
jgi:hypothetical protein